MWRPPISLAQWRIYRDVLTRSHARTIEVAVLDLDGNGIRGLQSPVVGGQVDVQFGPGGGSSRSASVQFLDPSRSLRFDSDDPHDGALYADRMIQIHDVRWHHDLAEPVGVPIFTGPLDSLRRSGPLVTVQAQDISLFGRGQAWTPMAIPAGTRKGHAIRTILRKYMGQSFALDRASFGQHRGRLPKPINIGRSDSPWDAASRIAAADGYMLYADGGGVVRLRRYPQRICWTFRGGHPTRASLLGEVNVDAGIDGVKNVVWVRGRRGDSVKSAVQGVAVAPADHPLSPRNLGPAGAPRRLVEEVDAPQLGTSAACRAEAERILADRLRQAVDVTYPILPMPIFDPGDLVAVAPGKGRFEHRLQEFSIPLGHGAMSIGHTRIVSGARLSGVR